MSIFSSIMPIEIPSYQWQSFQELFLLVFHCLDIHDSLSVHRSCMHQTHLLMDMIRISLYTSGSRCSKQFVCKLYIYFKYFLEVIFFSHRAQQILGTWYWSITHKDVHIKTARALRTASTRIHMHTCNSPNHSRWHRGWCLRLWLSKICIIIMSTLC